ARAFEDPMVAAAIGAGRHGAIEAAVLEWSDRDKQIVTVGWTRIGDPASAAAFAARVRASQRSSNGLTAIGDALLAARRLLDAAPDPADRRLVDLSGDGIANIGPPVPEVRDELVAAGITINGLAILASEPWLESYYDEDVIGGPGAFLLRAEDFSSFATAMHNKLLSEVSGLSPRRGKRTRSSLLLPAGRGGAAAPDAVRSDAVCLERREAVEADRRVARRIGAGRQDLDLVADREIERQLVLGSLVEDVGAVAGRAGDHRRADGAAARRPDAVLDALVHRLGQPGELADVEIDPALLVVIALLGDKHDLALDDSGIADQRAAGLDDDLGQGVAEMPGDRPHHRRAIARDAGHAAVVARGKAAADIDHAQGDVGLGEQREHARGAADGAVPLRQVGLLRADMEGDAIGLQTKVARLAQEIDGHLGRAAELARQRPFGAGAIDQ